MNFEYKDKKLESIDLSHYKSTGLNSDFSEHKFSNQMLALVYLNDFDVRESDFDNRNEIYSYQKFLNIISRIEQGTVFTTDEKHLMISYSDSVSYHFSITVLN